MTPSSYERLNLSVQGEGRVAILEFDHGKANEMGVAELGEIERLTAELEASEVAALVTWSRRKSRRGTPIFVAGANVTERTGWTDDQVRKHVRRQRRVLQQLKGIPQLHIGVVAGVALGWGTEYLLCCDYRIGAPGAVFGLPETGLGILPGAGGTGELWAHIGVAHTLRLGMTGERIGPDEAMRLGLIQECAESSEAAMARALELGNLAALRSPSALAAFKRAVLSCVGAPGEARTELEADAYEHCVETGEAAIGRAHFAARREGRPPWGPRRLP